MIRGSLDIPSALGVGFYPVDMMHWHMALTNPLPLDIAEKEGALAVESAGYAPYVYGQFGSMESGLRTNLIELLNCWCTDSRVLTIYHTYEHVSDQAAYVDPSGERTLSWDDPIRFVRTSLGESPHIFYDPERVQDPPYYGWMVSFFVNRRGNIVIFGYDSGFDLFDYGREGQVIDACTQE